MSKLYPIAETDREAGAAHAAEGFPRDPNRSPDWLAGYDQFHADYADYEARATALTAAVAASGEGEG